MIVTTFVVAVLGLIARLSSPESCLKFGIASNYQYSGNLPNAAVDVPGLERDGVSTLREDLLWSVVQPSSPQQWNWQPYDHLFATTSRLGVRVLPIVGYGTTWATGSSSILQMPDSSAGQLAYARFAAAAVVRYGPTGTFWAEHPLLPRTPINAVELWNEPWFQAGASVDSYVRLLSLAGTAVHQASPGILVAANVDDRHVHGSSADSPLWGAEVLQHAAELASAVDRWAIHPYPRNDPRDPAADAIAQVMWLQRLLVADRAKGQIWVTEVGFSAATTSTQSPATSFAKFVTAMARTSGSQRVSAVWVFTSSRVDARTRPGSFDYGFNLVDAAGRISPALSAAGGARCAGG